LAGGVTGSVWLDGIKQALPSCDDTKGNNN